MNKGMHLEKYFLPIVVRTKGKGGHFLNGVRLRYLNAIRLDNLNSYSNNKIRKA